MKINVRKISIYKELEITDREMSYSSGFLNDNECNECAMELLLCAVDLLENVNMNNKLYECLKKTINKILE